METRSENRVILCYGDSNTFGHDPRSFIGDRYAADVRWTGRLAEGGWSAVDLGLNGRQIPAGEAEISAAAAQLASHLPADRIAVMLGTNDLLWNPGFRAGDAADRMEVFLRRLISAFGGPERLLLLAPPPMEPGSWVEEPRLLSESRLLAPLYAALAERLSVDFADAGDWGAALSFDGIHLTAEGHRAFAAGLLKHLDRSEMN